MNDVVTGWDPTRVLRLFTAEELVGELVRRGYERDRDVGLGEGLERDMLVAPLPALTDPELALMRRLRSGAQLVEGKARAVAARLSRRGSVETHRWNWMYRLTEQGRRELRAHERNTRRSS